MIPRNPSMARTRLITARHRTDLLATLIGLPAARRAMDPALARSAARSSTAKGGSRCAVAAL